MSIGTGSRRHGDADLPRPVPVAEVPMACPLATCALNGIVLTGHWNAVPCPIGEAVGHGTRCDWVRAATMPSPPAAPGTVTAATGVSEPPGLTR